LEFKESAEPSLVIARSAMARVLIIDDDEAVRRATLIMLEARGFDVVAVENGRQTSRLTAPGLAHDDF